MGERQRREAREKASGDVAFMFGFWYFVLPAVAIVAGAVGIGTGLVKARVAFITVALMFLLVAAMLNERWRISKIVYRAIMSGTTEVVVWLARVPVVGAVAEPLGNTVVLWLPVVVLAVVAVLL